MNTLGVPKTWKCFINGEFIRSESGRTLPINHNGLRTEYVPHSSRKDLRNAIEAATAAFKNWSEKTGYHRGQVLWRFAEMLLARQDELADLIPNVSPSEGKKEVKISAERIVRIAGWADKFQQILGCANPVSGPYHNFTLPTPIGASVLLPPKYPPLLSMATMISNALATGCTAVVLPSYKIGPLACAIGEVASTSDFPNGAINILPCKSEELIETLAKHRGLKCIVADLPKVKSQQLQIGQSIDFKRVTILKHNHAWWSNDDYAASPWSLEAFVESKTIWHPASMK